MPTATIPALSVLLSVSAALAGACDPATQFPDAPPGIPAAAVPAGVTSGDFNGDGLPDAATSLFFADQIEILLGNGDGTFASVGTIPAGANPFQIETTDLNKDAHADLVFVNTSGSSLSVLLGNGNGTFQPAIDLGTGDFLGSFAIGDLNGDDALDLIAVSTDTSGFVVVLGNGDGTFQPAQLDPGERSLSVRIGHFNNDPHADLALIVNPDQTTRVALGNGDGTFQPVSGNLLSPTGGIAVDDLDGDGLDDLVAGDINDTLSIFLGNGDGTFAAPVAFPTGGNPETIVITDLDGDSVPDLATVNPPTGNISVLLGNGDGTFQAQNQFSNVGFPVGITFADFNLDGAPDLLTSDVDNSALRLFTNLCGPFFPVFGLQPETLLLDEGGDASFSVSIDNDPAATFQWRRDGFPLDDGPGIAGAQSSVLMLNDVDGADVGAYDVIATNQFGSTTSVPAILAVRAAPDCPGDTDGSGIVNFADLVATLGLFGPCPE